MHKVSGVLTLGVVVALVTACSGSSSPANNAGGPGSGSPGTTPTASASSTPSVAPSASTGASAAPTPTPATGHTVATGPGSKPPGSPTGFTRAGTYTYDLSGSTTTRLGTQKISGTDTLAVDPPKGTLQKTTQTSRQGGSRNQTLNVKPAGLFVVDADFNQPGFKEDFKPVGTATYFPGNYHVGSAWKWSAKSTDGKYTLSVSSTISSKSSISLRGQSIPVLIIDSVLRITGANFDLTDNQRDWVSTAYALVVKEHLVTSGKIAGFSYSGDETRTIRSTTPTSG
jgi:hypothetical protein